MDQKQWLMASSQLMDDVYNSSEAALFCEHDKYHFVRLSVLFLTPLFVHVSFGSEESSFFSTSSRDTFCSVYRVSQENVNNFNDL